MLITRPTAPVDTGFWPVPRNPEFRRPYMPGYFRLEVQAPDGSWFAERTCFLRDFTNSGNGSHVYHGAGPALTLRCVERDAATAVCVTDDDRLVRVRFVELPWPDGQNPSGRFLLNPALRTASDSVSNLHRVREATASLQAPEWSARHRTVLTIAESADDPAIIPALVAAIGDADDWVAQAAVHALQRVAQRVMPRALPRSRREVLEPVRIPLLRALAADRETVRWAAAESLRHSWWETDREVQARLARFHARYGTVPPPLVCRVTRSDGSYTEHELGYPE